MTDLLKMGEREFLRRLAYEVSHEPFMGPAVNSIRALGITLGELIPFLKQFNSLPPDFPNEMPPPLAAAPWETRGHALRRIAEISDRGERGIAHVENDFFPTVEAALNSCLREFESEDFACQERAVEKLRIIGAAAIPALVQGLSVFGGYVNRLICDALGEMGDSACGPLAELLASKNASDREWALFAFGAMGLSARPASQHLRAAVDDSVALVRIEAVRVLQAIGEGVDSDIQILIAGLSDLDYLSQLRSALYLTEFDERSIRVAVPALLEALGHRQPEIRQYAKEALERLVLIPEEAASAFARMLLDDGSFVQRAADTELNSPLNHGAVEAQT